MPKNWKTKLIHSDVQVPRGFQSLASPVFRGSTVVFPSAAAITDSWNQYEAGYTYGLYGTPTALELAGRICELEHGYRTILTPGGQAAISLINFALLEAGDHLLLPESIYGPHHRFASDVLKKFGIDATFYPPTIGQSGKAKHQPRFNSARPSETAISTRAETIQLLFRSNTRMIWCESPGSITMEIQDVPAIVAAAHRAGVMVAIDNTWAAGIYFDALAHGVDVTMQALTKYIGGHSDLLLGSITVQDEAVYRRVGLTHKLVGCAVSADDCSLALRGMKTLAVRLKHIEGAALEIANWLSQRSEIELVLHPAIASCPGHEIWKRDFTGSAGVFSIVFCQKFTKQQVLAFVDALELFKVGYSWGGVTSLALVYDFGSNQARPSYGHRIVRLNVGLEEVEDLKSDLQQAFQKMNSYA